MSKLDKAVRDRPPISSRVPSKSTLEWANRQAWGSLTLTLLTSLRGSQIWDGMEWEVVYLELDDLYAPPPFVSGYLHFSRHREKFVLEKT